MTPSVPEGSQLVEGNDGKFYQFSSITDGNVMEAVHMPSVENVLKSTYIENVTFFVFKSNLCTVVFLKNVKMIERLLM